MTIVILYHKQKFTMSKFLFFLSFLESYILIEEKNVLQIFSANSGRSDTVKHNLANITRARFVRFQPTEFSTHKSLRVELYGVLAPQGKHLI